MRRPKAHLSSSALTMLVRLVLRSTSWGRSVGAAPASAPRQGSAIREWMMASPRDSKVIASPERKRKTIVHAKKPALGAVLLALLVACGGGDEVGEGGGGGVNPSECAAAFICMSDCNGSEECAKGCVENVSHETWSLMNGLVACVEEAGCTEANMKQCMQANCGTELKACLDQG